MTAHENLRDDHRTAFGEPLGERVDQHVFLVGVEHVREAGAVETDATGEALARRIGDEVDLGQVRAAIRPAALRPGLTKDEPKPRSDRADHGRRMRARTAFRPPDEGTNGESARPASPSKRDAPFGRANGASDAIE